MGKRVDWVSVPDLELGMASVSRSGSSEEEPRSASGWVRPSALAMRIKSGLSSWCKRASM